MRYRQRRSKIIPVQVSGLANGLQSSRGHTSAHINCAFLHMSSSREEQLLLGCKRSCLNSGSHKLKTIWNSIKNEICSIKNKEYGETGIKLNLTWNFKSFPNHNHIREVPQKENKSENPMNYHTLGLVDIGLSERSWMTLVKQETINPNNQS